MRPLKVFAFFSPFFLATACEPSLNQAPECLDHALALFKTWCCADGAAIDAYTFQGQTVYLFDPGLCGGDFPSYVLDGQCDTLGFLGGFPGFTEINGQPFAANAQFQSRLWSN
ncbi:hypothetical protein N9N00_03765 [Schleiferiaceae bacterium]|jgi:hypothetical protein|nr:hypothetical protein [Schleiferiaceae bacterium]